MLYGANSSIDYVAKKMKAKLDIRGVVAVNSFGHGMNSVLDINCCCILR